MLQTVMQLSKRSRTTSYSISFQPVEVLLDQHLRAVRERLGRRARAALPRRAQTPEPRPPERVTPTRSITGIADLASPAQRPRRPMAAAALRGTCDADLGQPRGEQLRGPRCPRWSGPACRARVTPYRSSTPASASARPQLSAVWPPKPSSDRVGPLALDHLLDELRRHRQEIDPVGEALGGLDGGDVRVDQDGRDALLLERLDRLAPGVVELAGLADLQRAAAEDQDLLRLACIE